MTLPLDRVLQQASPVLPVLVIEDVALAPDLARVVCGRRHGAGSDAAHAAGAGRDRRHPSRGARGPAGGGYPDSHRAVSRGTRRGRAVRRQPRMHAAPCRRRGGCRPAIPARGDDAFGSVAGAGVRLSLAEAVPGRWHCQRENAEKPEGAVHRHPLLPDRRGQPGQPAEFPPPAQCRLCRRHLAGAAELDPGAGLGSDHTTGQEARELAGSLEQH